MYTLNAPSSQSSQSSQSCQSSQPNPHVGHGMCPAYLSHPQVPFQQAAYATGVTATDCSTVQHAQHAQHAQHSVPHAQQFQPAHLMHYHHHHHNRRSPSPPAEEPQTANPRGACARHAFDGSRPHQSRIQTDAILTTSHDASSMQQRRTKSEVLDIESAHSADVQMHTLPTLAPPGLPKTRCSLCSLAFMATCGCVLFVVIVLVELPLLALFGYKMALENHAI